MIAEPNYSSSREAEEGRIVAIWLERLRDTLSDGTQRPLFHEAMEQAGVSEAALQTAEGLRQRDLDHVLVTLRAKVPDVTLRLFDQVEILDLGLVGYAAINSDSVGAAIRVMYQYHSLASDRYTDQLTIENGLARISPTPLPGHGDDFQNICEDSFSGNWRALRLLLGPLADSKDVSLHLEYREPGYAHSYSEIFGPNCFFNADYTGLEFPAAWLEYPVHRGSGALSEVYTAMCQRVLGLGGAAKNPAQQVRRLLLSRAGRDMPSLESAAQQLHLTPGQLRKRLYREDTSYKKIVLEIRMELARHYLLDTDLSVQEIAYLLDYSTPAPFSRAFKRYCGLAPEYFRAENAVLHVSTA
ncbi:AraC family transcriptional regulator ligand-binding domain-containing protein [Congregibacter brevis]|uniref:AraC family transcriptional regulator ligand-binding domain-containing protein n=1 Tax=Congregibacter brevis TaxID=3081201 RepID=A0ABZ0IGE4_9GAMM|nr:AraC family transcriptional regulator ligand-binding domain-containing protein [Congregibacter sp. IMCC45268]